MKCENCAGATVVLANQRHHYTESGLENVYLEGVEKEVCKSCGESSVAIPHILNVHAAIARAIALQQTALHGADVKFLRKQLGLRARAWARLLRVSTETLSRWENNEQRIGPQSDSLIRLLYFRTIEEKEHRLWVEPVIEKIASVQSEVDRTSFFLVDVKTFQASEYPSFEEMPSREEFEEVIQRKVGSLLEGHVMPARVLVSALGRTFGGISGGHRQAMATATTGCLMPA